VKNKKLLFDLLFKKSQQVIGSSLSINKKLKKITELLYTSVDYYDWIGFYLVKEERPGELYLGPYVGEDTIHTQIAFGDGICGQAAERQKTFVIQDVSKEKNYLSCSPKVKSEIVVPIFKDGILVGELDIDSHKINPFGDTDKIFLEKLCGVLSSIF
jgi:L-methionine (R)-S-oxide reductase